MKKFFGDLLLFNIPIKLVLGLVALKGLWSMFFFGGGGGGGEAISEMHSQKHFSLKIDQLTGNLQDKIYRKA